MDGYSSCGAEERRQGDEVKDPGKLRYWRMEGLEMQLLGVGEVRSSNMAYDNNQLVRERRRRRG